MIVIMLDMYRYVILLGDFHFWNAEPQLAATLLRSEKPAWALRNYREAQTPMPNDIAETAWDKNFKPCSKSVSLGFTLPKLHLV